MNDEEETLEDWLYAWEAAVESGQSRIAKEEAIKRYYQKYPEQNDERKK
jgi:hypothetical protein